MLPHKSKVKSSQVSITTQKKVEIYIARFSWEEALYLDIVFEFGSDVETENQAVFLF
jgi:hypothetical protein